MRCDGATHLTRSLTLATLSPACGRRGLSVDAGPAELRRVRAPRRARAGGAGVDDARRRSRDAGLGDAEARRRAADELPPRIRRGRRKDRALFHDRHQARPGVALLRRPGLDQPARAHRSGRVRARGRRRARLAARARRGIPRRDAGAVAADGVGPVRLHGLRHGRAVGAHPRHEPRHAQHSRRAVPAPDRDRDLRQHRRHHHRRDAGLARRRSSAARGL